MRGAQGERRDLAKVRRRPRVFALLSAPVDTAVFTASRLSDNSIGGCYDDNGEFVANTEGIIALREGLKGSSVTALECAANPKCCLPSCQRPLTRASFPWQLGR